MIWTTVASPSSCMQRAIFFATGNTARFRKRQLGRAADQTIRVGQSVCPPDCRLQADLKSKPARFPAGSMLKVQSKLAKDLFCYDATYSPRSCFTKACPDANEGTVLTRTHHERNIFIHECGKQPQFPHPAKDYKQYFPSSSDRIS